MSGSQDRLLVGQPVFLPFLEVRFEQIIIKDLCITRPFRFSPSILSIFVACLSYPMPSYVSSPASLSLF